MKNNFIGLVFVLTLIVSSLHLISAADSLNSVSSGLEENVDKLNTATDQLSNEDTRTEYLKQEWTKILEKYQVGRFILGVGKVLAAFNPIFLFFIGIEYSLSWLFVLSFGTWIAILILVYHPARDLFNSNKLLAFLISLIITAIAAQFNIIPKFMSFFVPVLTNKWATWIALIIGIVIMYGYSFTMRNIGNSLRNKSKKDDEERREQKAALAEKVNDIKSKA